MKKTFGQWLYDEVCSQNSESFPVKIHLGYYNLQQMGPIFRSLDVHLSSLEDSKNIDSLVGFTIDILCQVAGFYSSIEAFEAYRNYRDL